VGAQRRRPRSPGWKDRAQLVLVESPYGFVLRPLVDYILKVESECPNRQVTVPVPELVVKCWWQAPLHNQRAPVLNLLLLMRGNQRIMDPSRRNQRAKGRPCPLSL
jgi:hypothetical protein